MGTEGEERGEAQKGLKHQAQLGLNPALVQSIISFWGMIILI